MPRAERYKNTWPSYVRPKPPQTFKPFPELPDVTLRTFGIRYKDHLAPTAVGQGWQPHHRYMLFRQGIAEMLRIKGDEQLVHAGRIACSILRPKIAPKLLERQEELGVTYHHEVPYTKEMRRQAQQLRDTQTGKEIIDLFYELTVMKLTDMPESWQQLHDETVALANSPTGE